MDAQGGSIQKGLFMEMKRRMPKQYKGDSNIRWLIADAIAIDWADAVSDRGTILGDAALQGAEMAPLGTPMVRVPLIPDDGPITVSTATSAEVLGAEYGPFQIDGTNDVIELNIDSAGLVTITLPHGTIDCVGICNAINTQYADAHGQAYANIARDNREGQVLLTSPTTGGASTIVYSPVVATSQGYTVLGLLGDPGVKPRWPENPVTITGTAAGSYSTVYEGSFIMLTNPRNLIFGILDGTRVFTEFNKNTDQIESIIYNQCDVKVENVDAVVKATNVRKRTLTM